MNFPDKKYRIIYADPPWTYGNFSNKGDLGKRMRTRVTRYGITPYPTMSSEDLKKLPVNDISDKNSILLMWVTLPCLKEGLELIEAWGFDYRTVAFTWVKKNKSGMGYFTGLGNYTRANAELCLLARRGKGCTVMRKDISQICDSPITKHSKKPDIIRQKIMKLFGDLPRIELFARTKVHGWDVWGNDEKLENTPLEVFT